MMPSAERKKPGARLKFNFLMGILHAAFYNGGIALGSSTTVLPVFLSAFTNSKILIGLSSSITGEIGNVASVLPQLFVANRIEHKIRKKPLLIAAIVVRAFCWGALAALTYFFAKAYPAIIIAGLLILLFTFNFMGGVASVPFMDIWGKAIPSDLRGRFFGYRQAVGGLAGIGSGVVIKRVLDAGNMSFPDNYALLFFIAFILITVSYFALGSVKEPREEVHKRPLPFGEFMGKVRAVVKNDGNYRSFLIIQILGASFLLSLPFFVLYAREVMKVKLSTTGVFLSAQMAGSFVSNFVWAYISDFIGNKKVIQLTLFTGILAPAAVFFIPVAGAGSFAVVFVLVGFFMSGRAIGKTNFLLDAAPGKDRPMYVSIEGSSRLPVIFYPLIGGLIVQYSNYKILFLTTAVLMFAALLLSFTLREPRARSLHADISKIENER